MTRDKCEGPDMHEVCALFLPLPAVLPVEQVQALDFPMCRTSFSLPAKLLETYAPSRGE